MTFVVISNVGIRRVDCSYRLEVSERARYMYVHHYLFMTLLLGSKEETVLVKQLHEIQTKMNRLYRKMTVYGHFSI